MSSSPQQSDPDRHLVTRAREGDTQAFDELMRKYHEKLYGLVYNMIFHKEDAHDLLQEIFAKAYHSLGQFRGHSTFYTWIYQIAVNRTLNFLKKRNRRAGISLDESFSSMIDSLLLVDSAHAANPERQTHLNQLQERLNAAMLSLSNAHRAVVTMFDVQGMHHAEIAEILKISEGTVRSRLHYAHHQLQLFLKDDWNQRF